jgi:hypothetical protein
MDQAVPFNPTDNIVEGDYMIETKNYIPLHTNGWYDHNMVQFCLDENIITRDDIKFLIKLSLNVDKKYFN